MVSVFRENQYSFTVTRPQSACLRKGRKKVKTKGSGLFKKYFLTTIAIILASFAVAGGALMLFVSATWLNERSNSLVTTTESVTESIGDAFRGDYMGSGRGKIILVCNTLEQTSSAVSADIFVINDAGKVVYCKDTLSGNGFSNDGKCSIHGSYTVPAEILEVLGRNETYKGTGDLGGQFTSPNIIVACPITAEGGEFRGAVVATKSIGDGLLPYVLTIFKMFVYSTLFAFIVTFIIVYLITYRQIKPLRQMSEAAKKYANGDFSDRIEVRKTGKMIRLPTEIDELSESFNSMAKALENLESSRRSFVSNVSHELKTPMTTIGGFIDGILDGTITGEDTEKYLRIVSDEVKRLSRLVTGMLNLSKIEAGQLDVKPTNFDISEMIFRTLLSFEQVIDKKNIEIKGLDTMGENPIFADKDMINQVVYNLVDNAVKFTPEGGYIEVSSKCDAEKVIVKIKNSGKGIAPEERDRIFERFYKIDKSRSFDVKGAGMGLFLVKTIIELHGGHIECRSKEGEYTEFIFVIPT